MHFDANTWAVLDNKLKLPREESDAMHSQRAAILNGKRKLPPLHRSGGGYKGKHGGGRGGNGGAGSSGLRGQGFRRGQSGGRRN